MGDSHLSSGMSGPSRRWVGGANVPTLGGLRVNASFPLAELILDRDSLQLRLRGPLNRFARAESIHVKPTDIAEVFPIRASFRFRGVGLRRLDGREYYFKTTRCDEILQDLSVAGFQVSWVSQPARKIWRATP